MCNSILKDREMGCVQYTWALTNSKFCVLCVTMNHLESHLMVLSSRLQSAQDGNLKYFDEKKSEITAYVINFRRLFFVISSDVPAFKIPVFASDFKFSIEIMNYIISRHSISNFARHVLLLIDHSPMCKLSVSHTSEKPSTTKWYFSRNY